MQGHRFMSIPARNIAQVQDVAVPSGVRNTMIKISLGFLTLSICSSPLWGSDIWIVLSVLPWKIWYLKASKQITVTPEAYLQGRETAALHLRSNLKPLSRECKCFYTFIYVETRPIFYWSASNPCHDAWVKVSWTFQLLHESDAWLLKCSALYIFYCSE